MNRDLDKLIAEKIFGHTVVVSDRDVLSIGEPNWDWIRNEGSYLVNAVPDYSSNLEDAMLLVEKIHFDFTLTTNTDQPCGPEDCWQADFFAGEFKAWGASPAEAICKAALKTLEPIEDYV